MSEIDPLHDNPEARLSQALRLLGAASASPRQAPAEVGETLMRAFRGHHARRRARRRAAIVATILVLSLPALLLLRRRETRPGPNTATHSAAPLPAPVATTASPHPVTSQAARKSSIRQTVARKNVAAHKEEPTPSPFDEFLPLRKLDSAVETADMRVMRLELTGRALRQVGAPVSAEMDDRRILADFVVGFDGTPYAVRLVQRHTY